MNNPFQYKELYTQHGRMQGVNWDSKFLLVMPVTYVLVYNKADQKELKAPCL